MVAHPNYSYLSNSTQSQNENSNVYTHSITTLGIATVTASIVNSQSPTSASIISSIGIDSQSSVSATVATVSSQLFVSASVTTVTNVTAQSPTSATVIDETVNSLVSIQPVTGSDSGTIIATFSQAVDQINEISNITPKSSDVANNSGSGSVACNRNNVDIASEVHQDSTVHVKSNPHSLNTVLRPQLRTTTSFVLQRGEVISNSVNESNSNLLQSSSSSSCPPSLESHNSIIAEGIVPDPLTTNMSSVSSQEDAVVVTATYSNENNLSRASVVPNSEEMFQVESNSLANLDCDTTCAESVNQATSRDGEGNNNGREIANSPATEGLQDSHQIDVALTLDNQLEVRPVTNLVAGGSESFLSTCNSTAEARSNECKLLTRTTSSYELLSESSHQLTNFSREPKINRTQLDNLTAHSASVATSDSILNVGALSGTTETANIRDSSNEELDENNLGIGESHYIII